eukprot:TRINITY_DN70353_c0_g1_i1.p1 TRINITY_DN70353_c0_g1~~TRINITY_DN70353_c0_g1_i1.p1  ORF type:complete len:138 (+),score=38.11 TRINITY_DN70353_c0_g1_i1:19-432(+)
MAMKWFVLYVVFFFFKQKTAYEMQRGLVGSEMCIRDRGRKEAYSDVLSWIIMHSADDTKSVPTSDLVTFLQQRVSSSSEEMPPEESKEPHFSRPSADFPKINLGNMKCSERVKRSPPHYGNIEEGGAMRMELSLIHI